MNEFKSKGVELIAQERTRQVEAEGYDGSHDDHHTDFSLTSAAMCYAKQATFMGQSIWQCTPPPMGWPPSWSPEHWKPEPRTGGPSPTIEAKDAIRMLTKAGALIAAEIDRLERASKLPGQMPEKEATQ